MPSPSNRADVFLVEHGYAQTRAEAQEAIEAGKVFFSGRRVTKASQTLNETGRIQYERAHPYVSRGALKLAGAINHFKLEPHGLVCLDIGASTGGFTELLILRGAVKIYAVDVGHAQMNPKLIKDPRVVPLEGVNARDLTAKQIPQKPQAIVADVSFISLKLALPAALAMAEKGAWLVALVKPQFEAGRDEVGKGGVITDPAIHDAVIQKVTDDARAAAFRRIAMTPSPITGASGNREFFLHLRK